MATHSAGNTFSRHASAVCGCAMPQSHARMHMQCYCKVFAKQDVRASGPQQIAGRSGPSDSPSRPALAPVHVHSDLPAGARGEVCPKRKLCAMSAGGGRSLARSRLALSACWGPSARGRRAQALRLREQVDGLAPGVRRAGRPRRRGRLRRAGRSERGARPSHVSRWAGLTP